MKNRRRHGRYRESTELNITAFMNLMVILVPFLLITAVFSRMTILELNMPEASAGNNKPPAQGLALELIVRHNLIQVVDRHSGPIADITKSDAGYDFAKLSDLIQKIKGLFPDNTDATLLLEPDIPYDVLVQVMDTVRIARIERDGVREKVELFPDIAIGDTGGTRR